MSVKETLPFPRGTTFFGAGGTPADDTVSSQLEGREYEVEDTNPGTQVRRSNKRVTLRVVRNVSGAALLPKHLVTYDTAAGNWGRRIIGYNRLHAAVTAFGTKGYPIDEYLGPAGVANNDLCYIVIRGPAICLTAESGSGDIVVGTVLIGITAATSTTSTANATTAAEGKVRAISASQTTASLDIFNVVGIALTARSTTQTATEILVEVGRV